jgi:carboxyl-terminal processing protease
MKAWAYVAIGLAFTAIGYGWRDIKTGQPSNPAAWQRLAGVVDERKDSPDQVFKSGYRLIRDNYIRPVKADDLKFAGMQGLMAALGDPHTLFMPPSLAKRFSEETVGNFFGVGARLSADPMGAKAVNVFEGAPAWNAGMRPNDVIIAVNGKKVTGIPTDDIVTQVKGPENTIVNLTILRSGAAKPLEFRIKRGRITTPTVESKVLEGTKIGYLSVSNFAEPTADQFDKELNRLDAKGITGLVIDLRGNPGGLLETAADMLSRFVENKTVLTMRKRDDEEVVRTYSGAVRPWPYPVAVLIDENSASAAEIFAGVLRDYGLAKLVGTHSYGKASVQNLYPLIDRSSAKITIAKYYLPSGDFIGRKVDGDGVYVSGGLAPDILVELDFDSDPVIGELKKDNQLAKAVELLEKK